MKRNPPNRSFRRIKEKTKEPSVVMFCDKCGYKSYYYGTATPDLICPTCKGDKKKALVIRKARERYLKRKEEENGK